MSLVTVKVKDEEFQAWLKRTENAFVHMIETMKSVARYVGENTLPMTPFETGKLGRSFKWTVVTDNSRMKVLQIRMSALNEDTGYDYAWIQHENASYHHPSLESQRTHPKFHEIQSSLLAMDGSAWQTNHPRSHYLYYGIRDSMEGAFQIIEDDYLSLFTRGYIF